MNNTYYSRTRCFFFFFFFLHKLWINDLCPHSFCLVWCQIHTNTLYNVLLRIARNLLETRENVKISTHPFYHTNLDWFSKKLSKKKFKIANSRKNFAKISQIGPWVSRIDWCKVHWCSSTYMVVRLHSYENQSKFVW